MTNPRRVFLKRFFSTGVGLITGFAVVESCKSKKTETGKEEKAKSSDPCSDFSDLSKADLKARESLGYASKAPSPNKHCGNCKLWLPAPPGKPCGKCQLFKGPVPAEAYCTYWAPQE